MSRPWMWRWAVTSLHLGVILLPTNRSVGAPTPHLFAAPARASLAAATPAARHEVVVLLRADSPLVVGAAGKLSSSHPGLAGILTRHGFAQAARLDRGATSSGPGDRGGGYYRLTSLRTDCDPVQAAAELRATGLFRAVVANTSVRLFASRPSYGELQKHRTAPRPTASLPDDPYLLLQWHIDSGDAADVALPEAWDLERGNPGVVIAIMDTGVDTGHPDLAGALWTNPGEVAGNGRDDDGNGFADDIHGWDFGGDDADPRPHATPDVSGLDVGFHGTHTAGIASAATDNGIGIAGAGWDCGLMALKVTDPSGAITDAAIAAAFAYAGDMGAAVLSMSFGADGAPGVPEFFQALVNDATAAGVLCVAAAGNDSTDATVYPAANDHVLAVGATDETNGRAFFSNYGAWVDVAAPGTLIFSSICDNYEFDLISQLFYLLFFGWDGVNPYMVSDGTSMACPLTAGVCALVRAAAPNLSPDAVAQLVASTGDVLPFDHPIGTKVNALHAVQAAQVVSDALALPARARLDVVPNPFNPATMVHCVVPGAASLGVYDGAGRLVRRLAVGPLGAGEHAIPWDGKDDAGRAAASGVYFVRLEGDGVRSTRKAVLLR